MTQEKYPFKEHPIWAPALSGDFLLSVCVPDEKSKEIVEGGKGMCYWYGRILHTSNQENEEYLFRIWQLNTPQLLQSASIMEFVLRGNESVAIDEVGVVRDGVYLDKRNDIHVRVFDDERSSLYGLFDEMKKMNCVIQDLGLGDIIVFGYTRQARFDADRALDKKYFQATHLLPTGYWLYRHYQFTFFQERIEPVKLIWRYFRTADGALLPQKAGRYARGEKFSYKEDNLQLAASNDRYGPGFEIATEASWEQVAHDAYLLHEGMLEDMHLESAPSYAALSLGKTEATLERDMRKIIEFVQNDVIYLFDAEVMHGHVPQNPGKTFHLKSGDCKAKSVLLIALLRTLGVAAEPILVNYGFDGLLGDCLPSPFVFSIMKLCVSIIKEKNILLIQPGWVELVFWSIDRSQCFLSMSCSLPGDRFVTRSRAWVRELISMNSMISPCVALPASFILILFSGVNRLISCGIILSDFPRKRY